MPQKIFTGFPEEKPTIIASAHLDWLCQARQITHTLCLIWCLTCWCKAADLLLYLDREGLLKVIRLVLIRAIELGHMRPIAYDDQTTRFPHLLRLKAGPASAANDMVEMLEELKRDENNDPPWERQRQMCAIAISSVLCSSACQARKQL